MKKIDLTLKQILRKMQKGTFDPDEYDAINYIRPDEGCKKVIVFFDDIDYVDVLQPWGEQYFHADALDSKEFKQLCQDNILAEGQVDTLPETLDERIKEIEEALNDRLALQNSLPKKLDLEINDDYRHGFKVYYTGSCDVLYAKLWYDTDDDMFSVEVPLHGMEIDEVVEDLISQIEKDLLVPGYAPYEHEVHIREVIEQILKQCKWTYGDDVKNGEHQLEINMHFFEPFDENCIRVEGSYLASGDEVKTNFIHTKIRGKWVLIYDIRDSEYRIKYLGWEEN